MLIIFDNSMQLLGTGGQFEAQVCNSKKVMTKGRSGLKISAVRSKKSVQSGAVYIAVRIC